MTAGDGDGRFRLGLAGAGRMGRTHLAALASSRQVRVTGLAEPDPAVRAAAARPGLPGFATVAGLLAAGNLDGVLVAAPTSAHSPIVTEIAAAGLPVLCEKPCGLDTAQAQACAAAADRAGVLLQVAYWRRFVPELAALRQRIRAGELGQILAVNCYQWDEAPPGAGFRGASGGLFADMGVHEFDQVRWLTGQEFGALRVAAARPAAAGEAGPASAGPPALLSRRATPARRRSAEGARGEGSASPAARSEPASTDPDCGQVVAELDGGGTAMISLGRWHPAGDTCRVEVFGTAGTASVLFLPPGAGDGPFRAALRRQAEDFARAVRSGAPGQGASAADAATALDLAGQAAAQLTAPAYRGS
ncbi:MAG TPA: Gfo/Idh/MocA family oxidoreductase [Streptosporangiaceae bacterium]